MADGALSTTNLLLGALVLISVLEAVALAIVVVVAMRLYAQMVGTLRDVQQQLKPLAERANDVAAVVESITTDVKAATARAALGAEKASAAFETAVGVARMVRGNARASVVSRALPLLSIARGLRVAYRSLVADRGPNPQARSSKARRPGGGHRRPETTLDRAPAVNDNTEAVHDT
jgi:hypothetical protein